MNAVRPPELTVGQTDALATALLERCHRAGVLPGPFDGDWRHYHAVRDRVRATYEVPATTLTPLTGRLLYGVSAVLRPRRLLGVGTYAGNLFTWLLAPGGAVEAVGVDVDADAVRLARRNTVAAGISAPDVYRVCDGHDVPPPGGSGWDLLFLDADDPVGRKEIYLSLLDRLENRLAPGAMVVAHDVRVEKFAETMARLRRRLGASPYTAYVEVPSDECGLGLAVWRGRGGGP